MTVGVFSNAEKQRGFAERDRRECEVANVEL